MKRAGRSVRRVLLSTLLLLTLVLGPYASLLANTVEPTALQAPEETITLTIHYQPAEEDQALDWKLWIWGEGRSGEVYTFEGEDEYGFYTTVNLPADWGRIGVIARGDDGTREWAKQTADLFPTIRDGAAEIWLRGIESQIYYNVPPEAAAEAPTKVTLKIHYLRYTDQNYEPWNVWAWVGTGEGQQYPFTLDENGTAVATVALEDPEGIERVGLIVRKSESGNDWAEKNTPEDIFLTGLSEEEEIWIAENNPTIFYGADEIPDVILNAILTTDTTAELTLSKTIPLAELPTLTVTGAEVADYGFKNATQNFDNTLVVTFTQAIGPAQDLSFEVEGFGRYELRQQLAWLHSDEFNETYYYEGELGAIYTPEETTFRVWAPTAERVELLIYNELATVTNEIPLLAGSQGTWEHTETGDLNGVRYNYRLTFPDGTTNVSVDPYAKAVTANGEQTVVLDPSEASPEGWPETRKSFDGGYTDAIIYEAHIRDLTIAPDNGITHKGKFLGLTEAGTRTDAGNLSGLDYLKSLGVTHIQILPMYDFKSIDETGPLGYNEAYNWGYDPQNYNVPEGSYSTDPTDPALRITEMKHMIQTLHDAGFYVIMDVVYNHVFDVTNSPLHLTAPGYYFRYDEKGQLRNGTGVGNETASEQLMYRRYMVDSLTYWATEYQIDGFRFDLMGIHDTETMNQIEQALHRIDPGIILLGEGWEMGFHPAGVTPSDQYHAEELPGYAFFNDSLRDLLKGSVFEASEAGWVGGLKNSEATWNIYDNILGAQQVRDYLNASQSVVYNEAHDNLTMWDKLKATNPNDSDETTVKRHQLASTIQLMSNGMAFVHAGQEFMRTKDGDHNSYISPDSINHLDYDRVATFPEAFAYFKDLLALRQAEPLLRLVDYQDITEVYKLASDPTRDLLHYEIHDPATGELKYHVLFNAAEEAAQVTLPLANYAPLVANGSVNLSLAKAAASTSSSADLLLGVTSYEIPGLSAAVLKLSNVPVPTPTEPTPTEPGTTEEPAKEKNFLKGFLVSTGLVAVLGLIVSFTRKQRGPIPGDKKEEKDRKTPDLKKPSDPKKTSDDPGKKSDK